MSRHRNLRHMVEEDYYDDYDDDYDDYDAHPAPKAKPAPSKAQPKAPSKKAPPPQQQQPPPLPRPPGGAAPVPAAAAKPTASSAANKRRAVPAVLLRPASDHNNGNGANDPNDHGACLTVVVCGHVDAGKSTVTGHLLHEYQRHQSHGGGSGPAATAMPRGAGGGSSSGAPPPVNFAWLLDEDDRERRRGVTMDVATKALRTPRRALVLLDAPGHADFVPAMITGTSQAEAGLLVVDVTDVTSSSSSGGGGGGGNTALDAGQLREHVHLARGLGVRQLLVAVNKMDAVGWSREAYGRVQDLLTPFLHEVGFGRSDASEAKATPSPSPTTTLRFLPVSGLVGTNIYDKLLTEESSWYHGPTLWEALDAFEPATTPASTAAALERPLRVIVTDVVGEQGRGVAVRGKVLQGWLQSGDSLVVLPIGDATTIQKVSSLQPSNDAERRKYAVAGEVIDFTLNNIDIMRVATGNVLCRPQERPPLATKCEAMVWILDGLAVPIIRGAQAIFHMHHLDIPCHMSLLIKTLKKDGTVLRERPRALTANTQAVVEVTLSVPIVMESFNDCQGMARFVLRRNGQSIAVGRIEKVLQ